MNVRKAIKRVKKARSRALLNALESFNKGHSASMKAEVQRAEECSQLLSLYSTHRRTRSGEMGIIAVVLIVIAAASVLLAFRKANVPLTCDIECQEIRIISRDRWTTSHDIHFTGDILRVNGIAGCAARFLSPDLSRKISGLTLASMELTADTLFLPVGNLQLVGGDTLCVRIHEDDRVRIRIAGSDCSGALMVSGSVSLKIRDSTGRPIVDIEDTLLQRPYSVRFSKSAGFRFLEMEGSLGKPWTAALADVGGLDFQASEGRYDVHERKTVRKSTIRSGNLLLPSVSFGKELRWGDRIELSEIRGKCDLAVNGSIRVLFDGQVGGITAGTVAYTENLMPTLFSHIYHNRQLEFLIGIIIMLGGLIWRAVGLIGSRNA